MNFATVATIDPDGGPQTSVVWIGLDDGDLVFSATEDRRKVRNLRRDPRLSVSITDAENGLPARNGRCAESRAESAAAAGAASKMAASVACSCCSPLRACVARPAQASTCSREDPGAVSTRVTRSRFSLSVPVLSKHTTSTRPSASTDRGLRTSAPALVSRRADAC